LDPSNDRAAPASEPKTPHIVITDREPGLPFSKGLMASQVMVTGLSPYRAYQVAEAIEDRLRGQERASVTSDEIAEVALAIIGEIAGERYAKNFLRWREVERLDVPLVILIGGTTGVGKSTIATQLAARLGIVRVVATDAIREVMRSMLSSELMLPCTRRRSTPTRRCESRPAPRPTRCCSASGSRRRPSRSASTRSSSERPPKARAS
jgi:2-phosphoglycerate kinase